MMLQINIKDEALNQEVLKLVKANILSIVRSEVENLIKDEIDRKLKPLMDETNIKRKIDNQIKDKVELFSRITHWYKGGMFYDEAVSRIGEACSSYLDKFLVGEEDIIKKNFYKTLEKKLEEKLSKIRLD